MTSSILRTATFRTVFAFGLAAMLGACGGNPQDVQPLQSAASVQSAATGGAAVAVALPAVDPAAMPAPDCAADNCRGLRIIDANAEAFRYDAMRRAAFDSGNPQS
ncbi:hypothetical protein HH212_00860 [Massilia forsythiae]|uniref:Lipoprotein n=1 Tax=Massilia forsythiae TaxID=2728020 RepID=A0A7Z2VT84_9BURK|nr:hypothetical protein [Massilia forsythiae]QJD98768.1 hypothetical protein HH212_00860 [Massilia forsythiae]